MCFELDTQHIFKQLLNKKSARVEESFYNTNKVIAFEFIAKENKRWIRN